MDARDRVGKARGRTSRAKWLPRMSTTCTATTIKLGFNTSLSERGQIIPGVGFAPNRHDVLTGSTHDVPSRSRNRRILHEVPTAAAARLTSAAQAETDCFTALRKTSHRLNPFARRMRFRSCSESKGVAYRHALFLAKVWARRLARFSQAQCECPPRRHQP